MLDQVYVSLLCSAQALYGKYGKHVDPWMTTVGYFNSMRELGGMRRLVDDSIFTRCRSRDRRGLAKRYFGGEYLAELTSRMRSEEIPRILDRLESVFDPELEELCKRAFMTKDYKNIPNKPLDVIRNGEVIYFYLEAGARRLLRGADGVISIATGAVVTGT